MLGTDGAILFPLSWMSDLVVIAGYKYEFLTIKKGRNDHYFWQFDVLDFCEVIRLWLGGGKHLDAYLGKSLTSLSLWVFQIVFVTFYTSF